MENLKKMMLMLTCLGILVAFSSCLSDDDDNNVETLTPEQKKSQIFEMGGTYSGFMYFYNDKTLKTDSISCNWHVSVNDSVLTIPYFPVAVFANGINDSIARNRLINGGTQTFKATLHPYYNDNYTKGLYTFWMLADNDKMEFTIDDEGTSHNVKVDLAYQMYVNSYLGNAALYSVGQYMQNKMVSYILVKDVVIDNYTYNTAWYTYIYGSK